EKNNDMGFGAWSVFIRLYSRIQRDSERARVTRDVRNVTKPRYDFYRLSNVSRSSIRLYFRSNVRPGNHVVLLSVCYEYIYFTCYRSYSKRRGSWTYRISALLSSRAPSKLFCCNSRGSFYQCHIGTFYCWGYG